MSTLEITLPEDTRPTTVQAMVRKIRKRTVQAAEHREIPDNVLTEIVFGSGDFNMPVPPIRGRGKHRAYSAEEQSSFFDIPGTGKHREFEAPKSLFELLQDDNS